MNVEQFTFPTLSSYSIFEGMMYITNPITQPRLYRLDAARQGGAPPQGLGRLRRARRRGEEGLPPRESRIPSAPPHDEGRDGGPQGRLRGAAARDQAQDLESSGHGGLQDAAPAVVATLVRGRGLGDGPHQRVRPPLGVRALLQVQWLLQRWPYGGVLRVPRGADGHPATNAAQHEAPQCRRKHHPRPRKLLREWKRASARPGRVRPTAPGVRRVSCHQAPPG